MRPSRTRAHTPRRFSTCTWPQHVSGVSAIDARARTRAARPRAIAGRIVLTVALSTTNSGIIINIIDAMPNTCAYNIHTDKQRVVSNCTGATGNRQRRLAPTRARRHRRYESTDHRTGRGVRPAAVASAAVAAVASAAVAVLLLNILEVDAHLGPQVLGERLRDGVWLVCEVVGRASHGGRRGGEGGGREGCG